MPSTQDARHPGDPEPGAAGGGGSADRGPGREHPARGARRMVFVALLAVVGVAGAITLGTVTLRTSSGAGLQTRARCPESRESTASGTAVRSDHAADSHPKPVPVRVVPGVDERDLVSDGRWTSWLQNTEAEPRRWRLYAARGAENPVRVDPSHSVSTGAIDGGILVYSKALADGGGDIVWYDLATKRRHQLPEEVNSEADEYAPKLAGEWLLFDRLQVDDPSMELLLYNLRTGKTRTLARGYNGGAWIEPGQLSCRYATWSREREQLSGNDVYLHDIPAHKTVRIPRGAPFQFSPVVTSDGTLYFSRTSTFSNCTTAPVELVRYPPGGPARVLRRFPPGTLGLASDVIEHPNGSRNIYVTTIRCDAPERRQGDIYKIVDTGQP
jgi:hypothetical protein